MKPTWRKRPTVRVPFAGIFVDERRDAMEREIGQVLGLKIKRKPTPSNMHFARKGEHSELFYVTFGEASTDELDEIVSAVSAAARVYSMEDVRSRGRPEVSDVMVSPCGHGLAWVYVKVKTFE